MSREFIIVYLQKVKVHKWTWVWIQTVFCRKYHKSALVNKKQDAILCTWHLLQLMNMNFSCSTLQNFSTLVTKPPKLTKEKRKTWNFLSNTGWYGNNKIIEPRHTFCTILNCSKINFCKSHEVLCRLCINIKN